MNRREFLGVLGAASVLAACSSSGGKRIARVAPAAATTTTLQPEHAPFDTVVVLMMENRSFDHFLGWVPGADGTQAGASYRDVNGAMQPTHRLAPDFQGCAFHDPAHDWESAARHYDNGACDQWLATQKAGDTFPIGYYTADDLPVLAALARGHTVCDHYFCSVMGPTGPNRMYQWAATTDYLEFDGILDGTGKRPSNVQTTIFDRCRAAGVRAGYYAGKEPQSYAFASKKYDAITHSHADFFDAARKGTLPSVTFVDPDLDSVAEFTGTATDDHPYGDVRAGEQWIAQVYAALAASPQWDRMVFVCTFDEHGGFYDHVPPPAVDDDTVLPGSGPKPDLKRLGFRVPCIIGGPFAPARIVNGGPFEHCSTLRMIEWRWRLEPMTARDRGARNLADALDFSARALPVALPALPAVRFGGCTPAQTARHV